VITRTVQFTVRLDAVDDAVAVIRTFLEESDEPGTLRDEVWQHGLYANTFMQLLEFADSDAAAAHTATPAYQVFADTLHPLCLTPPTVEEWHPIEP